MGKRKKIKKTYLKDTINRDVTQNKSKAISLSGRKKNGLKNQIKAGLSKFNNKNLPFEIENFVMDFGYIQVSYIIIKN